MEIYTEITSSIPKHCVVTVGFFDGVHLGHRYIIETLKQNAEQLNTEEMLITMNPHPAEFFGREIKLLSSLSEKLKMLEMLGVKNVLILPFNAEFAGLSGKKFVEKILHEQLFAKKLVLGYNNSIGKKVNGVAEIPEDIIPFERLQKFVIENQDDISSSSIRNLLLDGNIETANRYLGYEYSISGKIVHGFGIGRKLNFPTANIEVSERNKLVPMSGVYIVETLVKDIWRPAMLNIGIRPTFNGDKQTIELHILSYSETIYDEIVKVKFLKKIRKECKFNSVEMLVNQLIKDKEETIKYFSKTL